MDRCASRPRDPRNAQHIEGHRLGTDKGGGPHGCGDLVGAAWPLEGEQMMRIIVGSIVQPSPRAARFYHEVLSSITKSYHKVLQ